MDDNLSPIPSGSQMPVAQLEVESVENTTSKVMDLRKEISDLIAPWRESAEKPPFTTGELSVFALVYSDYPLRADDIHLWILNAFNYYKDRALRSFVRCCTSEQHSGCSEVVDDFPRDLREFDLPVHVMCYDPDGPCLYGIATGAARVYLRRWLEPARHGTFRFLDLSAELRNRVYELVLKISDDGLNHDWQFDCTYELQLVREDRLPRQLAVDGVAGEETTTDDPFYGRETDFILHLGPSSKLLALLCTCKQIRQEASSIFYGAKTFRFGPESMHFTLQELSSDTKEQIRSVNIALDTRKYQAKRFGRLGRWLQPLALERLKLTLDHRHWFHNYNLGRNNRLPQQQLPPVSSFSGVDELKPFIDLARRAKEVTFFEMNARGFEDYVREQLRETLSSEEVGASEDSPIALDD
ncbi:hypothetical protein CBER1_10867 [Cercospora berteroae]|uniref:Uncharacterized protein n=1 Tax=Cercospora berteroae TaxID=357750 RepID=A0A2S6BYV4_9PEZI|nr:hypothetical protein CBER1_10867 [Cercospora berteroae]